MGVPGTNYYMTFAIASLKTHLLYLKLGGFWMNTLPLGASELQVCW